MSAQRRTATRRDTTATTERPPAPKPVRTAAGASAAAVSERPSRAPRPQPERPAKPAERGVDRTKAVTTARTNLWAQRAEGLRQFYADTRSEFRKINWPDQETTRALTIVVIGISVFLGILLGGIDFLLLKLLEALP